MLATIQTFVNARGYFLLDDCLSTMSFYVFTMKFTSVASPCQSVCSFVDLFLSVFWLLLCVCLVTKLVCLLVDLVYMYRYLYVNWSWLSFFLTVCPSVCLSVDWPCLYVSWSCLFVCQLILSFCFSDCPSVWLYAYWFYWSVCPQDAGETAVYCWSPSSNDHSVYWWRLWGLCFCNCLHIQ